MKAKLLFKIVAIYICMCMITFISCEISDIEVLDGIENPSPGTNALPEGNLISALNGNVFIDIPSGAVVNPVRIEVNKCELGGDCNFLLSMVELDPVMNFEVPVTVLLKYDGELVCNETCPEDCEVIVCFWERQYDYLNRLDYMNRVNVECIECTVNPKNKTISFQTMKTGLFGLSVKNFKSLF